jgi:hypothetical protein
MRLATWTGRLLFVTIVGCGSSGAPPQGTGFRGPGPAVQVTHEMTVDAYSDRMIEKGRDIFRHDTFGSEAFWGSQLRLHEAIAGAKQGGVGPGLTAKQALELGLKVDAGKLGDILVEAIKGGSVDLGSPKTTMELLRADAVVGVRAFFDDKKDGDRITSVGITCALCHSTVDDSLTKGIGNRRDGWPNRDLDVGAIVALAPSLEPFEKALGVNNDTVKKVLKSWGPGKYDAELIHDGKAFRPDGKSAATVLPAAFGLAGQNLHTYTGWGSVPYWNAYVANTQMHGMGTFVDRRLGNKDKFPVTGKTGMHDKRDDKDLITSKLPALHYYQLSLPAPRPPKDAYDGDAAKRGFAVFKGKAQCGSCHVPPLYSEPGWPMHTPEEIGIDDFQAKRSPDGMYRTTPLLGLFTRAKGGFYHDGRFPTLEAVVEHYRGVLGFELTAAEHEDLLEFLKSL